MAGVPHKLALLLHGLANRAQRAANQQRRQQRQKRAGRRACQQGDAQKRFGVGNFGGDGHRHNQRAVFARLCAVGLIAQPTLALPVFPGGAGQSSHDLIIVYAVALGFPLVNIAVFIQANHAKIGNSCQCGCAHSGQPRAFTALRSGGGFHLLLGLGIAARQHLQRLRNLAAQRPGIGQVDRRHRDGENQNQRGNRRQRQAFSQTDNHGVSSSI